jgi:hypothetical protein
MVCNVFKFHDLKKWYSFCLEGALATRRVDQGSIPMSVKPLAQPKLGNSLRSRGAPRVYTIGTVIVSTAVLASATRPLILRVVFPYFMEKNGIPTLEKHNSRSYPYQKNHAKYICAHKES